MCTAILSRNGIAKAQLDAANMFPRSEKKKHNIRGKTKKRDKKKKERPHWAQLTEIDEVEPQREGHDLNGPCDREREG